MRKIKKKKQGHQISSKDFYFFFCDAFLNIAFQNEAYSKCAFVGGSKCVPFLYRYKKVKF